MGRELILTGKFKKSLKLAKKRGLNIGALDEVVTMLQNDISHYKYFFRMWQHLITVYFFNSLWRYTF